MSRKQEQAQEKPQLTKGQEFAQDLYFWLQALAMALVALILLFTFVGRIIAVDGPSMLPTLHDGDMLLLRSIGYTPKQGDVVVLTKDFSHYVDQPIVKRVIAVGGQTVRIDYDENQVYVDGTALDEPYINEAVMIQPGGQLTISELTVPEGSVFVLGDNRNNSSDSRHVELGAIDNRYILGEAVMILLPFQDFGIL
jgi:signal peptidase I